MPRENGPAYLFLSQIAEDEQRNADAIDWLEKIQGGELYISAVVQACATASRAMATSTRPAA